MMRKEFEQKTGIYPSLELYSIIEKAYMESNMDQTAFCRAYAENQNGLAEAIQTAADLAAINRERENRKELEGKEKRIISLSMEIERLKKDLEREQEWKPYEIRENVSQSSYELLAKDAHTEEMDEARAKELLYNWFGFSREKIVIHHSVDTYEANRHGRLRKSGKVERIPLYNATDWNYIRFDCGCMSYELINGDLRFFS